MLVVRSELIGARLMKSYKMMHYVTFWILRVARTRDIVEKLFKNKKNYLIFLFLISLHSS